MVPNTFISQTQTPDLRQLVLFKDLQVLSVTKTYKSNTYGGRERGNNQLYLHLTLQYLILYPKFAHKNNQSVVK